MTLETQNRRAKHPKSNWKGENNKTMKCNKCVQETPGGIRQVLAKLLVVGMLLSMFPISAVAADSNAMIFEGDVVAEETISFGNADPETGAGSYFVDLGVYTLSADTIGYAFTGALTIQGSKAPIKGYHLSANQTDQIFLAGMADSSLTLNSVVVRDKIELSMPEVSHVTINGSYFKNNLKIVSNFAAFQGDVYVQGDLDLTNCGSITFDTSMTGNVRLAVTGTISGGNLITLDANGGSWSMDLADGSTAAASKLAISGQEYPGTAMPTNAPAGKMFGGWYTDQSCTQNATFPMTSGTLYAKWIDVGSGAKLTSLKVNETVLISESRPLAPGTKERPAAVAASLDFGVSTFTITGVFPGCNAYFSENLETINEPYQHVDMVSGTPCAPISISAGATKTIYIYVDSMTDLNDFGYYSLTVSSSGGGSGGGGSSDSSDDNYTSVSTPETSGGSTTVDVSVTSTISGSTASATVSTASMNSAVDSVLAEAAKRGTAPVVEIKLTTSTRADSLDVKLPVASLKTLAEANSGSLVVSSGVVDVTLNNTALNALVGQATGSNVSLEFAPVAVKDLTMTQREIVGAAPVVDLSLLSNGAAIHDYRGGSITVSLPYTLAAGQSAGDIVVYSLGDGGSLEACRTTYEGGKVTFVTTHLSKYVIGTAALAEKKPAAAATTFPDVPSDAYYAEAVAWAVKNGVTYGNDDGTFAPGRTCTRAEIMTFLWRAKGSPKASGASFDDVSANAYYAGAVAWAVANGITYGTSDTAFSPDKACTRAEAMSFLYRAEGSPAASGASFSDVGADAYYASAVSWAVANRIAYGTGDGVFSPDMPCSRADILCFLYRDMGN